MAEWWAELSTFQMIIFIIAAAGTTIMILQIILMLIGGLVDSDASFSGEVDADTGAGVNDYTPFTLFGLKIVSTRTIIAFFTLGSWMAFAMAPVFGYDFVDGQWISLFPGIGVGLIAAVLIALMAKGMEKAQQSGNVSIDNSIGKNAEVYLTIPAKRAGTGKISVVVQERLTEYEAITDKEEPIKTGTHVKIVGTLNEGTVIVE
ncbi:MAG: hypothetical protein FWE22_04710 [Firmicutes bacterium]|nr:hypothetical protein [Bacillota bacterium]